MTNNKVTAAEAAAAQHRVAIKIAFAFDKLGCGGEGGGGESGGILWPI